MLYWLVSQFEDAVYAYWAFAPLRVLDEIQFRVFAALVLAFAGVVLGGPATIRQLKRMRIGDAGLSDAEAIAEHQMSKADTPTMGGALIALTIGGATILLADLTQFYVQMALIVLLWMALVGGADDWLKLTAARRGANSRQGLYSWEKLAFQLGIGLLVGYFAFRHGNTDATHDLPHVLNLPFQKTYVTPGYEPAPGLWFLPAGVFVLFAALMIAGMSNAANITDGMDGLATGLSAIVSVGLVVLALVAGSEAAAQYLLVPHIVHADELAVVAGAMAGACLGFLWWNCAPARVFMGDTGSLSLGGLIGYIAVITRQEIVVLIISGVMLAEIASVAIQVGVFKATRAATGTGRRVFPIAPFHHALHLRQWKEEQVVVRLWIIGVLCLVIGLVSVKLR
ncbi:MAG: phospho-N-acetylmuramoyl-pentapeptide-transferase [Planctomycetota bacterium]